MSAVTFTEMLHKSNGKTPTQKQSNAEIFDALLQKNDGIIPEQQANKPQEFSVFKTDDEKRLVFGWANVSIRTDGEQIQDLQDDLIDPEDLEEAAYEYVLEFRDCGEEHIPELRKKARMVESCMFTKEKMQAIGIPENIIPEGWWIGFKVDDDEAWGKVKNGTYQMFSIEGTALRVPVEGGE